MERFSPLPARSGTRRSAPAPARGTRRIGRRRAAATGAAILTAAAVLSGCARFDGPDTGAFHPVPQTQAGAAIEPGRPPLEEPQQPPSSPGQSPDADSTPPGPCTDPDPAVIATCLGSTGALVMLPNGRSALVAERTTGKIMRVSPDQDPSEYARVDVDPAGDGGLTGLALSPAFPEDHLIYAYITTPADNRVVRLAAGDAPKPILTGIPRGDTGNSGDLVFTAHNELTVLTGDAGNTAAASDPANLAGKVLRLTNPAPHSGPPAVVASGMGRAGGLCRDPQDGTLWITDRTPTADRLQRLPEGGTTPTLVWSWPDRPGVGGCAAAGGAVVTALDAGKAVAALTIGPDSGAATGDPVDLGADEYGHYGAVGIDSDGKIWASTINTTAGDAVPSDDRVVIIPFAGAGGSRV